jgi:hypothetical protein
MWVLWIGIGARSYGSHLTYDTAVSAGVNMSLCSDGDSEPSERAPHRLSLPAISRIFQFPEAPSSSGCYCARCSVERNDLRCFRSCVVCRACLPESGECETDAKISEITFNAVYRLLIRLIGGVC